MALPDVIEIVPLDKPVRAEITVPGSKSITNRALILAALADGEVTLTGALWSEDTQIMVECLQKLGFEIRIENDPAEFCNRTITVKGLGGKIPNSGTAEKPLELFVGNAGTAARFLSAFVCLGDGVYRLSGVPRMHERPQAALFRALRELGYRVETENGNEKLPVKIFGGRSRGDETQTKEVGIDQRLLTSSPTKKCRVSIEQSSQFASALLLCAKVGNWEIEIVGENAEESPYVAMTSKLMEAFPKQGGIFQIEPDASSGSYFWAVGWLFLGKKDLLDRSKFPTLSRGEFARIISAYEKKEPLNETVLAVVVKNWPISGWQIDQEFPWVLYSLPNSLTVSRKNDLGDSVMTAIVLAPLFPKISRFPIIRYLRVPLFTRKKFVELGRLRHQETERVVALRDELTKCGVKVTEEGDKLKVWPSKLKDLHGAEITTYDDHRMAMCFAILGLKVSGIKIKNPACVKKTFPNFFQKVAGPPPNGLGAEIWEIKNGERTRKLSGEDLFAD